MKKILSLILGATLATASTQAQSQNPAASQWNDPSFVKEFLGSYGFLAGAEPQITDEEKEGLRALVDLIKVSPTAAIKQLEPQINNSSSAAFDFILANLYFQNGNLENAEKYYTNATTKHPDFRRAYKNLGLVQVQQGNFEKAIKTISKAMELGEVDGRSYGLLGYGYLTQERYYPAEAAYRQAILMQPDVIDWKVGLVQCLLQTARYKDAIALFDTLIKDDPSNTDYWILQSNAYIGDNQPLKAAQNIETARRMGAADLATLTLLGDIYLNNESPDLALIAYLEAVKLAESKDIKSLIRATELFNRTANYPQAKAMLADTRAKFPELDEENELKLLTIQAKIASAEGDDDSAIATLSEIIKRDNLNGDAMIELANLYAAGGDMAKAINRYQQAEKIDEFERQALVAHAQARVRNSDYKAAVPLLKRALAIKSDSNLEEFAKRVERAAKNQG